MHRILGPILYTLGLSCREFTELAARRMDEKLTTCESLRFRTHWIICSVCRQLPRQLENLSLWIRESLHADAPTTPPESLARIKRALDEEQKRGGRLD